MASPENPVELPGAAPPENKVDDDVVPPLLPSDYASRDKSDDEDEGPYTSTQQRRKVIHRYLIIKEWNIMGIKLTMQQLFHIHSLNTT